MNVVDALVITLGLDPKQYEKGRKDVKAGMKDLRQDAGKTAKELQEQGKHAAEFFSSVKVELLGLLAAFGAATGLKDFIFGSITSGAALGRLSQNLQLSTQRLDAWDTAAASVGETAQAVAASMQSVAAGLAASQFGDYSYFQKAAIDGIVLNSSMTPEQALLKISAQMQKLNAEGHRQAALRIANDLGVGGIAQTALINGLQAQLALYEKRSKKTPQLIAQEQQLQQNLAQIYQNLDAIKDRVFVKLGPELEKLATQLERFLNTVNWDKVITRAQEWFGAVGKVVDALGGVKTILIEIAAYKALVLFGNVAASVYRIGLLTKAMLGLKTASAEAAAAEAAAAAGGGAVPPVAGAGAGFLRKFLGGSSFLALLRGAMFAPRPAESEEQFHKNVNEGMGKADADVAKYGFWGALAHSLGLGSSASPNAPAAPVIASPQRSKAAARADDDIQLFGGKYSGKGGTKALFSDLEQKNGLPPGTLSSVFSAESSRGKNLVSPKGALGPFQFEPATAADYGLNKQTVFDVNKSADAAARYLRDLLTMFHGNLPEALAAYNWGQGNVQRYGMDALPKETQDYIRKVMGGISMGAAQAQQPVAMTTSTSSQQIHIGQITVHTKATDAKGIASDMRAAISNHTLVTQADTGLA